MTDTPTTDTADGPTWRNRAEAAEALGVSRQKIAGMARQGAPLPDRGEIFQVPLLKWAWDNRERVVGEKRARQLAQDLDNKHKKTRNRLREVELATAEAQYQEEAQQVFADSMTKLRGAMERDLKRGAARRLAELVKIENTADRERAVTNLLAEMLESCIEEALR